MASLPTIAKSESLENKAAFLNKHYNAIPMLKAFVAQGVVTIKNLDETAMNAVLQSNGMLALDELAVEDVLLSDIAIKTDPIMRMPAKLNESLNSLGLQSSEGLVKVNVACVFYAHRNHDTTNLANKFDELVKELSTYELAQ